MTTGKLTVVGLGGQAVLDYCVASNTLVADVMRETRSVLGCSACELLHKGGFALEPRQTLTEAGVDVPSQLTVIEVELEVGREHWKASVRARHWKDAGYTAVELKAAGYMADALNEAGYATVELKAAGYTARELGAAGCSALDLWSAGYEIQELAWFWHSWGQTLHLSHKRVRELKRLIDAGYTVTRGFQSLAVRCAGDGYHGLWVTGFRPKDLKAAGYSIQQAKFGLDAHTLVKGRVFTPGELMQAGYTESSLLAAGCTKRQLKRYRVARRARQDCRR